MKLNDFLSNAEPDHPIIIKEESKNLSKEDALDLIADFVKKVKEKFTKKEDALEILRSAEKTLTFYINELAPKEEDDDDSSLTFIRHSFGDGMARGELEL